MKKNGRGDDAGNVYKYNPNDLRFHVIYVTYYAYKRETKSLNHT